MKKLVKFLPLIIAICAIADTKAEVLKGVGLSDHAINIVKLIGLLLTIFLPSIKELFIDLANNKK